MSEQTTHLSKLPTYLDDTDAVFSEQGLAVSDVWYHGTTSVLLKSIKKKGLKRSGDRAMKAAAKQTMATIGNSYAETTEPVFLTQSKALAHYWAAQAVRNRSVRIEGKEKPVVVAVSLPEPLNAKVRPDVGAASLLLVKEGEQYMGYLASLYEARGLSVPSVDLMTADRMVYLNALGMAYYDGDIPAEYLEPIKQPQ